MRLYHGTTERHLEAILRGGIHPRGEDEGNWEDYPSRPDMVYLTSAYPLYFAAAKVEDGERLLILELELDQLCDDVLFPDEDVVAQSISHHEDRPLPEVHKEVVEHLEHWQDKWEVALSSMGTVAYQSCIGPLEFQRAALVDLTDRHWLGMTMLDPMITPINFRIKGEFYTQLTEWVMGHRPDLPGWGIEMEAMRQMDPEMAAKREAFLTAEAADRSGIEVIDKESWNKKVKSFQ